MRFYDHSSESMKKWINENRLFVDAYYAANRDEHLKAEIEILERKYIRKHLIEAVGKEDADRIMSERGYLSGLDTCNE